MPAWLGGLLAGLSFLLPLMYRFYRFIIPFLKKWIPYLGFLSIGAGALSAMTGDGSTILGNFFFVGGIFSGLPDWLKCLFQTFGFLKALNIYFITLGTLLTYALVSKLSRSALLSQMGK